jgi:hypothetical protein
MRTEYTLNHPMYDAFLFAVVGQEKNGLQLTVLSALARLDLDPWQEAARLANLTPEAATQALAARIAGLPAGDWHTSDSRSIADRLVGFLPARSVASTAAAPRGPNAGPEPRVVILNWLIGAAIGLALVFVVWLLG